MRPALLSLLTVLCCGTAAAQAPATLPAVPAPAAQPGQAAQAAIARQPAAPGSPVEQRVERIRIEDDGSVVEEVRYGGQAQSITVSPKGPAPDYEIVPADSPRSRALSRDALSSSPGQRVWNVLKF